MWRNWSVLPARPIAGFPSESAWYVAGLPPLQTMTVASLAQASPGK